MSDDFDLFEAIKQASVGNVMWFDSLSDVQKSKFSPYMLTLWLSGTSDPKQINGMANAVNPYILKVTDKRLAWYLLCAGSDGKNRRYTWPVPKKDKQAELIIQLIQDYYHCSKSVAESYVKLLPSSALKERAMALGWDDKDIKQL